MSDLHQAVQARIAAHTPAAAPPFEALKQRKRARDHRRYAVAGGALSVAVVGAVAVSTGWPTGSGDRLTPPTVAGQGDDQARQAFTVRPRHRSPYFPNAGEGLNDCLALPGISNSFTQFSSPPQYSLTVTGTEQIAAFESCANSVPGYYAERHEEPAPRGYTPPGVEVRVQPPARAGQPVRIEAAIRDDRDVAVHRVEFGDGTQQIVRFTCVDASVRPGPAGDQTHVVDHTWAEPGQYELTFHYGPPCTEPTSSVTHGVTVSR